jgi:hypothetical protein
MSNPAPGSLLSRNLLSQLVELIKDSNFDQKKLRPLLSQFVDNQSTRAQLCISLRSQVDNEDPQKSINSNTCISSLASKF